MSDTAITVPPMQEANALLDSWGFGSAASRFHTSIAGNTPESNAAKLKMLNEDGLPISDFIGKEILVVGYLFRPAQKNDRSTGEVVNLLMVQMLCDDGRVISSFSSFVLRGLLDTASLFGLPSPVNPFRLVPRTRGKPPQQSHYLDTSLMTNALTVHSRKAK
jgi:hypothetical protein